MADFQTHIGASTVAGIAYAVWGYSEGAPLETAVLAGGLCSVSGMMPDLDSDSGIPARESFAFTAAVVPALMLDRFQHLGWHNEWIAVATGAVYFFVRFGVAWVFKHFTVHRGMWHSVPACFTAGCLTFLICSRDELPLRLYLSVAVMLGFFSHLALDELWSVNFSTSKIGLKSSWGTALKFWGDSAWANFVSYMLLFLTAAAAIGDPMLMEQYGYRTPYNTSQIQNDTREYVKQGIENARRWIHPEQQPHSPPTNPWR